MLGDRKSEVKLAKRWQSEGKNNMMMIIITTQMGVNQKIDDSRLENSMNTSEVGMGKAFSWR